MLSRAIIRLGLGLLVVVAVAQDAFSGCVAGAGGANYNVAVDCDDGSWSDTESWDEPNWDAPDDSSYVPEGPTMTPDQREGLLLAGKGYAAWKDGDEERATTLYAEAFRLFPENDSVRLGYCAINNNRALSLVNTQDSIELALRHAELAIRSCPEDGAFQRTYAEIAAQGRRLGERNQIRLRNNSVRERIFFYVQELEAHMERMTAPPNAFDFMVPGTAMFSRGTATSAGVVAPRPGGRAATVGLAVTAVDPDLAALESGLPPRITNSPSPKAELILDSLAAGGGDWWRSIVYLEALKARLPRSRHVSEALHYVRGISARHRTRDDTNPDARDGISPEEVDLLFGAPDLPPRDDPNGQLDDELIQALGSDYAAGTAPNDVGTEVLNALVEKELDLTIGAYDKSWVRFWAEGGVEALEHQDFATANKRFRKMADRFPDDVNWRDVAAYVEGLFVAQRESRP